MNVDGDEYTIPSDNPFVENSDDYRAEVFAYHTTGGIPDDGEHGIEDDSEKIIVTCEHGIDDESPE